MSVRRLHPPLRPAVSPRAAELLDHLAAELPAVSLSPSCTRDYLETHDMPPVPFTQVRLPVDLLADVHALAAELAADHPKHRGEPMSDTACVKLAVTIGVAELRAQMKPAADAGLEDVIARLGAEELAVLRMLATRLLHGQETYGKLHLETDARDFERERAEELADALVYTAIAEVKRVVGSAPTPKGKRPRSRK